MQTPFRLLWCCTVAYDTIRYDTSVYLMCSKKPIFVSLRSQLTERSHVTSLSLTKVNVNREPPQTKQGRSVCGLCSRQSQSS